MKMGTLAMQKGGVQDQAKFKNRMVPAMTQIEQDGIRLVPRNKGESLGRVASVNS